MSRIAFLGIGNMGRGMALRLAGAGHSVVAYNRSAEKAEALKPHGIEAADTPAAAAMDAEFIVSMVGDDSASRTIWTGPQGVLSGTAASEAITIECSTISHGWVMELSGLTAGRGLRFMDCPVTGLPDAAATGTLGIFVGADEGLLEEARPVLATMGNDIVHFGAVGSGIAYKLMINLMGAVQIAAGAEGLVIAEKAGLDLKTVVETLAKGQAASPQVVRNTNRMIEGDHDRNIVFSGHWREKDTCYGVEFARSLGLDAAFGETAGRIYKALNEAGYGSLNETKVIDILRTAADQS